jgi:hypothetical protein
MAALGLNVSLQVDLPAKVFGYETTPPFVRHDQMVNVASAPGAANSGTRCIKSAGIVCLEPQPWLVDQEFGQYSFPAGSNQNWTPAVDATTQRRHLYLPDATPDTPWNAVTLAQFPANAAFYAVLNRDDPGTGATLDAQHCYTEIVAGANADVPSDLNANGNLDYSAGVPVRLVFQLGRPPMLQGATVVDGAWVFSEIFGENGIVAADAGMVTEQLLAVNNRCLFVEWLPLPDQNQLVVSIRGLDDPLVLRFSPADGYPIQVAAGNVQLAGMNGTVGLAIFPMRFSPSGTFTSSQIQLPFVYPGGGFLRYYEASIPGGTTLDGEVAAVDETGLTVDYEIAMTGPVDASGLAYSTPYVQQVGLYVPPTSNFSTFSGAYADLSSYVSEVEEEQWFDAEKLTIRTQVGVTYSNASGYFSGATAGIHLAASYARQLTVDDGSGTMAPYSAPVQYVTGWTGMKTSVWRADPSRTFDAIIEDGLYPMERKQIGNVGFLDGWCSLRAIGFLAELSGRTDGFIDPLLLMCDCGPDPVNCPHFKLPLGAGDTPTMGFHPETTYLDAISQICQYIYGVVFADAYNILRIVPYYPGVYQAPFLGTFATTGAGDGDPSDSGFLSHMWNGLTMTVDTADRRTGVLFCGLDPATNEVQATYLNADELFGIPGLVELVHGFSDPLVVISRRFADPVFTAGYAQSALLKMFRPVVTTQHDAAFLPGMFAMARYDVQEAGYAIDGTLAMSCERISSRWAATEPRKFGSRVVGRSLYNV